jgi:hypothetical protein
LPRETKIELFPGAGHHKDLRHRLPALRELKNLEPKAFVDVLVETLESLPATPKDPYGSCLEGSLAGLVGQTADARAWRTLDRVARRSDVGLRMEFLNRVGQDHKGMRRERLAFLAAFLDDASVRDARSDLKMYGGWPAGYEFPRLEVRDLAAWKIASLLKLAAEPKPDWKQEQWAQLRTQARKALKR